MSQEKYLTKEGLDKLQAELKHLKTTRREEIRHRIEEAIKLGDLSENAEYHEAKDDQGLNEAKIRELEDVARNAVIIENDKDASGVVVVGSKIKVKFDGEEKYFVIVGPSEANPSAGLISNESPIGRAFIGHKKGDTVEVEVPSGVIEYKIIEVE